MHKWIKWLNTCLYVLNWKSGWQQKMLSTWFHVEVKEFNCSGSHHGLEVSLLGLENKILHKWMCCPKNWHQFLAHLSLQAHWWAYSIAMVRRPSVVVRLRPSSTIFKELLLQNCLANQSQISYGASVGWGNESLFTGSGSHDQDGHHAHIW